MFKNAKKSIGQAKINSAIQSFSTIEAELQEGIDHMESHVEDHRGIIRESEEAIDAALADIDRAQRVSKRIKAITE